MLFVFEVQIRAGHSAEQYAQAWVEASEIIQRAPGAHGTRLHRSAARPDRLLAIARWESKSLRDQADSKHDPRVKDIIETQADHVDIRVIGEFLDADWVVLPPEEDVEA